MEMFSIIAKIAFASMLLNSSCFCFAEEIKPLTWTLEPAQFGFTGLFNPDPVDVYSVRLHNPNNGSVFTVGLTITSDALIQAEGFSSIKPGAQLPLIGGAVQFADSFFVVNEAIDAGRIGVVPGTTIDDATTLAADFSVTGAIPQIGPNGQAIVATLSVPGGTVPVLPDQLGRVVVRFPGSGGVLAPVVRVPEPSSCAFAFMSVIALSASYRQRYRITLSS